jgi:hypothetical protein
MFRSDWCSVEMMDYQRTPQLFKNINPGAPIHTDAQFAFYVFKNHGKGEYLMTAWKKGREGFWNFMKIICQDDGYMRLAKKETANDKEKRELLVEYRKLNRQLGKTQDEQEKEELKNEIEGIVEDKEVVGEISEFECSSKHGCYPYLSSVQPIYKFHEYQSLEDENVLITSASQQTETKYKAW